MTRHVGKDVAPGWHSGEGGGRDRVVRENHDGFANWHGVGAIRGNPVFCLLQRPTNFMLTEGYGWKTRSILIGQAVASRPRHPRSSQVRTSCDPPDFRPCGGGKRRPVIATAWLRLRQARDAAGMGHPTCRSAEPVGEHLGSGWHFAVSGVPFDERTYVHGGGYPAWIRTKTNWTKTSCATITPRGRSGAGDGNRTHVTSLEG